MEIHDENKKEYASKSLAGTALGFGIAGTALSLLNSNGLGNLFGTKSTVPMPENVNINGGISTNDGPTVYDAITKEWQDDLNLTNEMWALKLNTMENAKNAREIDVAEKFSSYKGQIEADFRLYKGYRDSDDNILAKLNEAAFGLYKYNRDSKDAVEKRISDIETKLAVNAEADKWRDKVLSMQINGVNANAENLVALERERRQCADNKIVNYVNSTFYPVSIADVTTGTTTTKASTYNPLCGCTCIR